MATIKDIVIDSPYPAKLARFWAAALDDHQVLPYDGEEIARLAGIGRTPETDPSVAVVGPGPTLFFNEVARPEEGKNRLHLDLQTPQREQEVARLVALR